MLGDGKLRLFWTRDRVLGREPSDERRKLAQRKREKFPVMGIPRRKKRGSV
jgi:hypothetical protein